MYLGVAVWAVPLHAEERSLVILFGSNDAEAARSAAKAAAATSRRWMQSQGAVVELRGAGSQDALPLSGNSSAKELEKTFVELAQRAQDSDFASFLAALDSGVQSLAQRPARA